MGSTVWCDLRNRLSMVRVFAETHSPSEGLCIPKSWARTSLLLAPPATLLLGAQGRGHPMPSLRCYYNHRPLVAVVQEPLELGDRQSVTKAAGEATLFSWPAGLVPGLDLRGPEAAGSFPV